MGRHRFRYKKNQSSANANRFSMVNSSSLKTTGSVPLHTYIDMYAPTAPYPTGTLYFPHGTEPPIAMEEESERTGVGVAGPALSLDLGMSTTTKDKTAIDIDYAGENGDIIPSAPPMEVLDKVTGYEDLSFEPVIIPPSPSYRSRVHQQNGDISIGDEDKALGTWVPSTLRTAIPQMTESVARSALQSHVKHHCCWGPRPARHMTVSSINQVFAYHYILQTFTERREARWTCAPHVGSDVDGPDEGIAPSPWDIPVTPPKLFHNEVTTIEVPHTASVKPCHRCRGSGTLSCSHCHGKGWTRCLSCSGEGWGLGGPESRQRCIVCTGSTHGHGRQDCSRCGAKGRVSCSVCDTYGQLKCFIQLTVSWKVTVGEHVTGGDDVTPDLIRQVEGEVGLEETGVQLTPLSPDVHAPDETLALASTALIHEHLKNSRETLLLAQRHRVRLVPVTIVDYQWKRYQGKYYIYGLDKRVVAPDYPQTCCCGCVIV